MGKKRNTYKDQTWRTCLDLTGFWKKKKVKLRANKLGPSGQTVQSYNELKASQINQMELSFTCYFRIHSFSSISSHKTSLDMRFCQCHYVLKQITLPS